MRIEEKGSSWGFLFGGAALGVAMGAVLGVLFAPKSGSEPRRQIGDWLQEKRDEGAELLAKIREESRHKKEQVAAALRAGRQAYAESAKHGG